MRSSLFTAFTEKVLLTLLVVLIVSTIVMTFR